MNYTVMAYTRRENRELESAMHLAAVLENGSLQPLQNGTGILFAKAEFSGSRVACTGIMIPKLKIAATIPFAFQYILFIAYATMDARSVETTTVTAA